jgi:O-antigen/teichoic acid export membrane protein
VFKRILSVNAPAHDFLRKSAVAASGQALGYGLALAASPVLSRLYSPGDFGLLAIFVTLTSVLGTIATLRFDNAIPLPDGERTAESLATLARWSVIFTSICLTVAALLFGETLNEAIFQSQAAPFSWLLAVAVATFASCEVHNSRLIRCGNFAELSTMRVVFAVACLTTQLSVPMLWMAGPLGLALGQIGGYVAELLLARMMRHAPAAARLRPDLRELRRAALEYRNYPLFDVSASLFRVLAVNGQALLIAWAYSPAAAGCLLLAQRLLSTPISTMSFSVSRVYYSEAAKLTRESPTELRILFGNTVRRLTLLVAPPLAVVCALAPWTFGLVFGPEWSSAGLYCSFLCPLVSLRVIAFVIGPTLDVVHRQGLRLARELACVVLLVLGILLARWLDWSELAAVAVTTALGCAGYVVAIALTWRALLAHHQRHQAASATADRVKAA